MTKYQLIKEAIETKQQITATYKGFYREMCPHVIGMKNGKEQSLFFQFGGSSSSQGAITPSTGGWRCLAINELTDVKIREGEWHTNKNHSQKQSCVDNIDAEIEY